MENTPHNIKKAKRSRNLLLVATFVGLLYEIIFKGYEYYPIVILLIIVMCPYIGALQMIIKNKIIINE